MREFFHGWRRKAGCVALAVACLIFGMWTRGYARCDSVDYHSKYSASTVTLGQGGVSWRRWTPSNSGHLSERSGQWDIDSYDATPRGDVGELSTHGAVVWRWNWNGLDFGESSHSSGWFLHYRIPYWCLVLPLTLLSAYLILWKPRPRSKEQPNA